MWVSVEGKKANSFKIRTESFINWKLSSGLSYLFVQWQQDLSFLEASLQMNIMPALPRWVVCHCWASRHVLHRCCGAPTPCVINPRVLHGVLKPILLAHFSLKPESPVCSKPALQNPGEQNSHDTTSAPSHARSTATASFTARGKFSSRRMAQSSSESTSWRNPFPQQRGLCHEHFAPGSSKELFLLFILLLFNNAFVLL